MLRVEDIGQVDSVAVKVAMCARYIIKRYGNGTYREYSFNVGN